MTKQETSMAFEEHCEESIVLRGSSVQGTHHTHYGQPVKFWLSIYAVP